ncbi:MAG: hypothetical protein WAU07_00105 [Microgenomates group bacterium]
MNFINNFFSDKNGNTAILQWPNWPLWLAMLFFLLQQIPNEMIQNISYWGLAVTLIYWSYLEIFYGDSNFRRILGVLVLGSQIFKFFI